jgi:hypothetical protein
LTVNNKKSDPTDKNNSDEADEIKYNYMNDTVTKPWAGTTNGSDFFPDSNFNKKKFKKT